MQTSPKIVSQDELRNIVEKLHQEGKSIVTTNGSFDILHIGHVKGFEMIKQKGDFLVVGLNSDSSIRKYKGPKRPINSQEDRAYMLAALESVDYICIFEETEIAEPLLRLVRPRFHAKGAQYEGICPEEPVVKEVGAQMYYIPMVSGFSTTNVIERVLEAYKEQK